MKHFYGNNNIKELFNKDVYHVFFLINPVVEIIIFLWIKTFKIPNSKVILLKLRKNTSGLINLPSTYFKKSMLDRIFSKLGYDRYSRKYEKYVRDKSIKFYLYSSWVHPEFDFLLNNENCLGHFYLEEGQLAHRKRKFINNNNYHIDSIRNKIQYAADLESHHREDAICFVSIDPEAFPHIDNRKKFLFDDFSSLKNGYNPLLLGKKFIGLGPAPRRLKNQKLLDSLLIISDYLPDNSIIKLHPGFDLKNKKLNYYRRVIKEIKNKKIDFCDQNIILEIEMLFENKIFYGPSSSLIRYAKLFKSEYKIIELYEKV